MNFEEILTQPESKVLEFKENCLSKDKILATVIAFANTSGGKIIVGIEDQTKRIVGIQDPYTEEERLSSFISDSVTPGLLFNIEILSWRNAHLLIVDVPMSSSKPHYITAKDIEKSCYVRVGSSNRLADIHMRESIKRSQISHSYDEEVCPYADESDIDTQKVIDAFAPFRSISKENMLSIGLFNKVNDAFIPSIGGILFFGRNKERFFPDAWLQAGCFQGTKKTVILDTIDIKESFDKVVEQALNFIRKHIKVGLDIKDIRHHERWEIPKAALREAILNAIVHKDYVLSGSPIRISIFDDRIEIENPGLLPNGLSIDDIKCGISKIRNRVIARVYREIKQIEQWGSGVGRIIDLCHEFGLPEPLFEEISDRFRVTLFRKQIESATLDAIEQEILYVLRTLKEASTAEIAKQIHYSERTVRLRLRKLVEKGFLQELSKNVNDPRKKFIVLHT